MKLTEKQADLLEQIRAAGAGVYRHSKDLRVARQLARKGLVVIHDENENSGYKHAPEERWWIVLADEAAAQAKSRSLKMTNHTIPYGDQAALLEYFRTRPPLDLAVAIKHPSRAEQWGLRSRAVPLIVNFGGGVDSTAMLMQFERRGIVPDLIIFADTGAEKPETYAHVERFSAWLVERGFPAVTVVSRKLCNPMRATTPYDTIEGNVVANRTVPSLAYGGKSCSLKWKAEPMDAWLKGTGKNEGWQPALDAWDRSLKPVKCIGYDCGPADSRRAVKRTEDASFVYLYPLRVWGAQAEAQARPSDEGCQMDLTGTPARTWDRERCEAEVAELGWEVEKSACFFCPASTSCELRKLHERHPELFRRAVAIEKRAGDHGAFQAIQGLGRKTDRKRPGNWQQWAIEEGILAEDDDLSDVEFEGLKPGVTLAALEEKWQARKAKTHTEDD